MSFDAQAAFASVNRLASPGGGWAGSTGTRPAGSVANGAGRIEHPARASTARGGARARRRILVPTPWRSPGFRLGFAAAFPARRTRSSNDGVRLVGAGAGGIWPVTDGARETHRSQHTARPSNDTVRRWPDRVRPGRVPSVRGRALGGAARAVAPG